MTPRIMVEIIFSGFDLVLVILKIEFCFKPVLGEWPFLHIE